MVRCVSIALCILSYLPPVLSQGIGESIAFSSSVNPVGYSDSSGNVSYSIFLFDVSNREGYSFPLFVRLSTDPALEPHGFLGGGWRFPLIDSALYAKGQSNYSWIAPGGRVYQLNGSAERSSGGRGSDLYLSAGGLVRLEIDGEIANVYDVENGFLYRYSKGRLVLVGLNSGECLFNIRYTGDRIDRILDGRSRLLVRFDYRYDRLDSLLCNETKVQFIYNKQDPEYELGGIEGGSDGDFEFSYRELLGPNRKARITASKVVEKKGVELGVVEISIDRGVGVLRRTEHISWLEDDGLILSDSEGAYVVQKQNGKTLIQRSNDSGDLLSYWSLDYRSGVEETFRDGTLRRLKYIMTPGRNHMRIRSKEVVKDGESSKETFSYAKDGTLLREVHSGGDVIRHLCNSNGVVQTFKGEALISEKVNLAGGLGYVIRNADGSQEKYYDQKSRLVKIINEGVVTFEKIFDGKGRPEYILDGARRESYSYRNGVIYKSVQFENGTVNSFCILENGEIDYE